jgi:DNA-binding PadR family transcriptional regulator
VAQMVYSGVYKDIKIGRREQLIMLEIGKDQIDTASSFVDYIRDMYGFSKSSVWYCLNRLRESRLVEFANRDEIGKPLSLTRQGLGELAKVEPSRNEIIMRFSSSFLSSNEKRVRGAYLDGRAYAQYR